MNVNCCIRYKVEPPGLIKLEKEIEQEERAPEPPPSPVPPTSNSPSISPLNSPFSKTNSSKKSTGKLLDDAVSKHLLAEALSDMNTTALCNCH